MQQAFDVIVLGTGAAAATAAVRCRQAGRTVAIVDDLPFGGTCALRGCDPKKLLRRGPEVVDAALRMDGNGIAPGGLRVDWPALVAFKRGFTDPVPESRERGFEERGIACFHGTARFVGETAVTVGEDRLQGRHVVVATGARPRPLDLPGADMITDSTGFMELTALPRRVLFVGGGYVSFEFAHIAARAGAEVAVVGRGERPLSGFDPDLVDMLVQRTGAMGIALRTNAAVTAVERAADDSLLVHAQADGGQERYAADLVVHGAGRVPAVADLDLDAAGVRCGERGIEVNEHLQSVSNPAVYAAGDVAATEGPPLTPVAGLEAEAAAANLLEGNHKRPDYTGVPSVVFSLPPLARVGLLESEAKEQGLDVASRFTDMSGWYSTRRVGESHAAARTLVENGSGRIVGAHLLGPDSGELINLFALAMRSGLTADDLKGFISAYPSAGSDVSHLL